VTYIDEFYRYYDMAKEQQVRCNLGTEKHEDVGADDLMHHVHLYDVVERKYAGFGQILNDLWYGMTDHPYKDKLHDIRKPICKNFDSVVWDRETWLFVFMIHRLTGSAINYSKEPSGYWNTILPALHGCRDIADIVDCVKAHANKTIYTSGGYQIAAFPKGEGYRRGGDYFICEMVPELIADFMDFMSRRKSFREAGEWMFQWNVDKGLRRYKFHYAAFLGDVADYFPDMIDDTSQFYYGSNAVQCLGYLGKDPDETMDELQKMTGGKPYDLEDVCCDFIRWIENYCDPKADYSHLDLNAEAWNSSTIEDHPYGRQKKMLELKLAKDFNTEPFTHDKILQQNNLTVEGYKDLVWKTSIAY
jgi:hypothetical protein